MQHEITVLLLPEEESLILHVEVSLRPQTNLLSIDYRSSNWSPDRVVAIGLILSFERIAASLCNSILVFIALVDPPLTTPGSHICFGTAIGVFDTPEDAKIVVEVRLGRHDEFHVDFESAPTILFVCLHYIRSAGLYCEVEIPWYVEHAGFEIEFGSPDAVFEVSLYWPFNRIATIQDEVHRG